ncbi:hypothetical protein Pcinc_035628 [Petrolisthes cinctipes]|uniref:Uncharacterized protein n=1 Tax=Petrolisthes cinctipes TaxID=88211 RepID=A0AAE1BZH1_PETCI|nr:hypothetical protein Pcinc_035628 [Petrolisthes cinctipes]
MTRQATTRTFSTPGQSIHEAPLESAIMMPLTSRLLPPSRQMMSRLIFLRRTVWKKTRGNTGLSLQSQIAYGPSKSQATLTLRALTGRFVPAVKESCFPNAAVHASEYCDAPRSVGVALHGNETVS